MTKENSLKKKVMSLKVKQVVLMKGESNDEIF